MSEILFCFEKFWAAYRIDPVLKNINWSIEYGQRWAIVGGNGSSKTALANVITGKLHPQKGYYRPNQQLKNIIHLGFELQRELMALDDRFDDSEVREDAFDIGTTVKAAILNREPETDRFRAIVERCGIRHILDRGIRFISTGESRKTMIARALLAKPDLLILDNPFEGLDKQSQHDFRQLIDDIIKGDIPTLLLIQKADDLTDHIDHVLQLREGQITYCGPRTTLEFDTPTTLTELNLPEPFQRDYAVPKDKPLIELNSVNVSYNEQAILRDVSWSLNWGQHCCIAGPNGSGKSTLLSLLNGDNHKAYGQDIVLFGQRRGSGESIWDIKKKFGHVSTALQLGQIKRMRVAEAIASGLYDSIGLFTECTGKDRQIALDWLKAMDLDKLAKRYFHELSFGQQRLVLIARAMVKSPLILILDEPCIGLDPEHRSQVLALIDQIAANHTGTHILYVSHSIDEMPRCINQTVTLVPHKNSGFTAQISL